jgi:hypothetical protein
MGGREPLLSKLLGPGGKEQPREYNSIVKARFLAYFAAKSEPRSLRACRRRAKFGQKAENRLKQKGV